MFNKEELQEKFITRTFDKQFRKVGLFCDPDLARQKPHLAVFYGYEILTESRYLYRTEG